MTDYVPDSYRTDTYGHRDLVLSPAFTTRAPLREAPVIGDDGRGIYIRRITHQVSLELAEAWLSPERNVKATTRGKPERVTPCSHIYFYDGIHPRWQSDLE